MRKPKNSILARNLRAKERERVFSSSQSTPASWQEESALLRTDSESHHHSLPERSSRLMTLFPASQLASVNARSLRLHIFPIPLWFRTSITVTSSQDILWCHPSHCPLSSVDLSSVDLIRKIFLTFTSLTIPFTFFFFFSNWNLVLAWEHYFPLYLMQVVPFLFSSAHPWALQVRNMCWSSLSVTVHFPLSRQLLTWLLFTSISISNSLGLFQNVSGIWLLLNHVHLDHSVSSYHHFPPGLL